MDITEAQRLLKACASDLRCGCDGGNIEGGLWYFGLEPGGRNHFDLKPEKNFNDDGSREAERVVWIEDNPYGRYFNQFFRAFFNLSEMTGKESAIDSCNTHSLLTDNGPAFKGNIYPISRKGHEDWENLDIFFDGNLLGKAPKITGWTLDEYRENMVQARKKMLLEKLEEKTLKQNGKQTIVVCTATAQRKRFADIFGINEVNFEELAFSNSTGGSAYLSPIHGNSGKIIGWLYVIPFFRGPNGPLTYEEQRKYATWLREVLIKKGANVLLNC